MPTAMLPLIVTPWTRDGRLRARCSVCLVSSDFTQTSQEKRATGVPCPSCGRVLRLNPFTMVRLPIWEEPKLEPPFGRFNLPQEDRTILSALARALDHQHDPLQQAPERILPQLALQIPSVGPAAAASYAGQRRTH